MWFSLSASAIGFAVSFILGGTVVKVAQHAREIGPCVLMGLGCHNTLPPISTTHTYSDAHKVLPNTPFITMPPLSNPTFVAELITPHSPSVSKAIVAEKLPTIAPATDFDEYTKLTQASKHAHETPSTTSLSLRDTPASPPTLLAWLAYWIVFMAYTVSPALYMISRAGIYALVLVPCFLILCYVEAWVRDVYGRRQQRAEEIRINLLYKANVSLQSGLQSSRSDHQRDNDRQSRLIATKDEAIRKLTEKKVRIQADLHDKLGRQRHNLQHTVQKIQDENRELVSRNSRQHEELGRARRLVRTREHDLKARDITIASLKEDPSAEYKRSMETKFKAMRTQRDNATEQLRKHLAGENQRRPRSKSIKAALETSTWSREELQSHIADLDFQIIGMADNANAVADKAKSDNEALKGQIDALKRDNETLREQKEGLLTDCNAIRARLTDLERESNALQEQARSLEETQKQLDLQTKKQPEERRKKGFRAEQAKDELNEKPVIQTPKALKLGLSAIVTTVDVAPLAPTGANPTSVETPSDGSASLPASKSSPPAKEVSTIASPVPSAVELAVPPPPAMAVKAPTDSAREPEKPAGDAKGSTGSSAEDPIDLTKAPTDVDAAPSTLEPTQISSSITDNGQQSLAESPFWEIPQATDSAEAVDQPERAPAAQRCLDEERQKKGESHVRRAKKKAKRAKRKVSNRGKTAVKKPQDEKWEAEEMEVEVAAAPDTHDVPMEDSQAPTATAAAEPEVGDTFMQDAPEAAPRVVPLPAQAPVVTGATPPSLEVEMQETPHQAAMTVTPASLEVEMQETPEEGPVTPPEQKKTQRLVLKPPKKPEETPHQAAMTVTRASREVEMQEISKEGQITPSKSEKAQKLILKPPKKPDESPHEAAVKQQLPFERQQALEQKKAAEQQKALKRQAAIDQKKAMDQQKAIDKQKAIDQQKVSEQQKAIDNQKVIDQQKALEQQRSDDEQRSRAQMEEGRNEGTEGAARGESSGEKPSRDPSTGGSQPATTSKVPSISDNTSRKTLPSNFSFTFQANPPQKPASTSKVPSIFDSVPQKTLPSDFSFNSPAITTQQPSASPSALFAPPPRPAAAPPSSSAALPPLFGPPPLQPPLPPAALKADALSSLFPHLPPPPAAVPSQSAARPQPSAPPPDFGSPRPAESARQAAASSPAVTTSITPSPTIDKPTRADTPIPHHRKPPHSISSLLDQVRSFEVPKTQISARHPLTDPGYFNGQGGPARPNRQ